MKRYVILDTETTGLDPKIGHRVIDVACVEVINDEITGREFQAYLDPERNIDADSVAIHGITNEMVRGKPKFRDVATSFLDFIAGAELVIHNAKFDIGFLNSELALVGIGAIGNAVLDTVTLAKRQYPGQAASLDALCKRFGISLDTRDKHGALVDSQLLAKVFLYMKADAGVHFATSDQFVKNIKIQASNRAGGVVFKINVPSEEELQENRLAISSIKGALWGL
jgi:DNA polymerase-3 subunit epsilon